MKTLLKILGKIFAVAAAVYAILFTVFYFDLDGKFLYHVFEPMMVKRYDAMQRRDIMNTPYTMKVE